MSRLNAVCAPTRLRHPSLLSSKFSCAFPLFSPVICFNSQAFPVAAAAHGTQSSSDDLSDADLLKKPLPTSGELDKQNASRRQIEDQKRKAARQREHRDLLKRNAAHANVVPEPDFVTTMVSPAEESGEEITDPGANSNEDDGSIPPLHRAARDAYIASAPDPRAASLAFAAAKPPSQTAVARVYGNELEDDDSSPSISVDYCVFCYHGSHLLNHEVSPRGRRILIIEATLLFFKSLQNSALLTKFVTDRGSILPKRFTHCCAKHQRQ